MALRVACQSIPCLNGDSSLSYLITAPVCITTLCLFSWAYAMIMVAGVTFEDAPLESWLLDD